MMRQCGDCQLCCRLLPVRELDKRANTKCQHQTFAKGCGVYHKPGMPPSCAIWNCRWLVNNDTAKMSRPDRSHYVIDIMPDYIQLVPDGGAEPVIVEVVQVWCDPHHPDAHRDPDLRAYLERRGQESIAALVRYSSSAGFVIIPPAMAGDGQWHEQAGEHFKSEQRSTGPGFAHDVISNLANARKVILG
jgi:hypothetical protein